MNSPVCRLLCVDLQVDSALGIEPEAQSVFGARQLLALGRRLSWTVVHARRRARAIVRMRDHEQSASSLNPLMSEKVFLHDGRSVADCIGLSALLHDWRNETVYVAAFDHVALLSCLLACYEPGPRLVLVEDVLSLEALTAKSSTEAFRNAAWHLATGTTTIADIIANANRRPGATIAALPEIGESGRSLPA